MGNQRQGTIREKRSRTVRRGKTTLRIEYSWHRLGNGDNYHYIHVYRGSLHLPIRRWAWMTTDKENA
ncbi:hypothetical protein ABT282_08550 [Streptomyces sp. NPDC000927]|uniref:hypothetical protein n=1 Tax=Streptomyces sp. NPDC000927 TaxID=3154371 RepID=UPI003330E010